MKVVHLLASGGFGGIECLIQAYSNESRLDNTFVYVWDGGVIYDEMCKQNIKCENLREKRGRFLHTVIEIIKKCNEVDPDIIVTHHDVAQFKLAIVYFRLFKSRIKTIAYAHENGIDIAKNGNMIKSFITKMINKMGFHCADSVVAISESVKKSIENVFKVPENNIKVIYNGINTQQFCQRIRRSYGKKINLLYVGRLIKEKGVQSTIEALSLLPKSLNWSFDIVGNGPYREFLEKQVQICGLSKKIQFLGERKDIPQMLDSHDIFIHMPEWEEGFGISIVEAMASGMICICLKKGGIEEIIETGVDGILVDSVNELALIIIKIMEKWENKEIEMMSKKAIDKAESFNISRFSVELDSLIEQIYLCYREKEA